MASMTALPDHLRQRYREMLARYHGSRMHSPNEHVRWRDVERGVFALVRTMERFAGLPAPS